MKNLLVIVGGLVLTAVVVISLGVGGLEWKRFFAPRHAEIDRQVFEQTPSFVHGKAQHLTRLRGQYELSTTDAQRNSLRMMIRHEASTIDLNLLPADLRNFILGL